MTELAIVLVILLAGAMVLLFVWFNRKLAKAENEKKRAQVSEAGVVEESNAKSMSADEQRKRMDELRRRRRELRKKGKIK